jgi:Protein of unknown function (DUF1569)
MRDFLRGHSSSAPETKNFSWPKCGQFEAVGASKSMIRCALDFERDRRPFAMKDLFDPTLVEDVRQRVLKLNPESGPQWGSMNVAKTLAHCTAGIEMAMGTIRPKRAPFPASFLGRLIKPLVFRDDKPMRRNSPSSPELFLVDPPHGEFERERSKLIAAIESFATQGAACCSSYPHPFFGPLKPQQWAILMYKHIDHHLRQFGV